MAQRCAQGFRRGSTVDADEPAEQLDHHPLVGLASQPRAKQGRGLCVAHGGQRVGRGGSHPGVRMGKGLLPHRAQKVVAASEFGLRFEQADSQPDPAARRGGHVSLNQPLNPREW